jgi:hypothetical protein
MTPLPSFQEVTRPLCERLGMAPLDESRRSIAFAIDEGLTIGLLGYQEGFLVAIAEIAAPVDPGDAQRRPNHLAKSAEVRRGLCGVPNSRRRRPPARHRDHRRAHGAV